MPFLHITTRIEGRKWDGLLQEKGGGGFPYMAWLDADGNLLASQAYTQFEMSVPGFEAKRGKLSEYAELKKKAEAGDAAAQIEVAILGCELGILEFGDMEEAIEGKELSDAQKQRVADLEVKATFDDMMAVLKQGRGSPDSLKAAGKEFLKLHKAGTLPKADNDRLTLYNVVVQYAIAENDAAVASEALDNLAKYIPKDNPRAKAYLDNLRKRIADMKADAEAPAEKESEEPSIEEGG